MKKKLLSLALMAGAGVVGYAKRDLLQGIINVEKPNGDVFVRLGEDELTYLCKNDSKSEDMLLEWVLYNGWKKADQIGEGLFFINDKQETLLLDREAVCGGRYLVWRASRSIDA